MAEGRIWDEVLKYASPVLGDQVVETWLKPLSVKELRGDLITLSAPNRFYKNWIEDKYLNTIKKIFVEELSIDADIAIEISNNNIEAKSNESLVYVNPEINIPKFSTNLNKQYTFDNFVVGSSNQFAFSAASAVAEGYFHTYNPLFIYGGVGLGKTHIMHAIGNKLIKSFPKLKILYISSESFTNEMIYSLKSKSMDTFRDKYRNIDVLLFDDVQFLAGKTRSTEEFFYTFNTLYDEQKQIIITSDKTPDEIPEMEERLTSRFAWGLIADIQPPNIEEKTAILLKRAEIMGIYLSDELALFLAENLKGDNVRELIGALIRLSAYASFNSEPLSIEFAKKCLDRFLIKKDKIINPDTIVETICTHFNVKMSELKSKKRTKSISLPRQIAMYILRNKLNISLQEIGEIFGGRDHSTVLHSLSQIESKIKKDVELKTLISNINKQIYK
jgi:chromosomal replication initiator protein